MRAERFDTLRTAAFDMLRTSPFDPLMTSPVQAPGVTFEKLRADGQEMDKPASFATRTLRQTHGGSGQEQLLVGRVDNSGARGFGCWLWISRPHATSSYTVGCG
jgi:hypothetical protein